MINRDDYLPAAHMMYDQGGSFARAIAQAFYVADSDNTQRLLKAFPDLFLKYSRLAYEERNRQEAERERRDFEAQQGK